MSKLSAKERMLNFLKKTEGYNTFSVAQAQARFGVTNVTARVHELRNEGYAIYTNQKTRKDGTKVSVYRLGNPSKTFIKECKSKGIKPQYI
jgi:hypothetical protein